MQGASTINPSLSTTLTLMINTLTQSVYGLKHSKESRYPDEQYKQDAYLNHKLITKEVSKVSSNRTWIHQCTSRRVSTNKPALPLNSSLTLDLIISIYKTRSYKGLIFSWLLALILMSRIWIRVLGWLQGGGVGAAIYRGSNQFWALGSNWLKATV